jgi:hypothetical protein
MRSQYAVDAHNAFVAKHGVLGKSFVELPLSLDM